jgi:hypothetical protein
METKGQSSSTMDALNRMAAGLGSRTIADNINNPNRPTWEQYKKENEDKLKISGQGERDMAEYRKQLDLERDRKLARRGQTNRPNTWASDSDGDVDVYHDNHVNDNDSSKDSKTRKREKKERKKEKKQIKKMRKRERKERKRNRNKTEKEKDDENLSKKLKGSED